MYFPFSRILVVTEMDFVTYFPAFPRVLKVALMTALSPAAIGSLGHWGVVQPQLGFTAVNKRGAVPVLVNLYIISGFELFEIVPKSTVVCSKKISGEFTSS